MCFESKLVIKRGFVWLFDSYDLSDIKTTLGDDGRMTDNKIKTEQ